MYIIAPTRWALQPAAQHPRRRPSPRGALVLRASSDNGTQPDASSSGRTVQQKQPQQQSEDVGAGLKAVWYGAEVFGKLVAAARGGQQGAQAAAAQAQQQHMSREQLFAAIRSDYDEQYFVRGVGDMAAYAPDCVFADPFVSFSGTQRFKQNVSNLGGLMSDIKLDVYDWQELPDRLETKWRFSALLDLPWQPRLAAAGGTTHVIDAARGLVVRHEERWDVEPGRVVEQLLRPAAKVPSNAWETFMLAASAGDGKGVWFVLSPLVLRGSAALVVLSFVVGLFNGGEGLVPGPAVVGLELLFAACVGTEVIKFAQGMQGGETGTGGRF